MVKLKWSRYKMNGEVKMSEFKIAVHIAVVRFEVIQLTKLKGSGCKIHGQAKVDKIQDRREVKLVMV
jgi:hypothetical protein